MLRGQLARASLELSVVNRLSPLERYGLSTFPLLLALIFACAFAPRCSQPIDVCVEKTPEFVEDGPRALRCHNPVEVTR